MIKHRLAYPALALAVACGGTDGSTQFDELGETGQPLTATASTGALFRLNNATFIIKDSSNKKVATVKPAPDLATSDISLKAGTYKVELSGGWILQRKVGTEWRDVAGTVTAQPTGTFKIKGRETTALKFAFKGGVAKTVKTATTQASYAGPAKSSCNGTARISMSVVDGAPALDCSVYSSKVSALASFTVDCLGTLNATQYVLQTDGTLARSASFVASGCTTPDPDPDVDPNGGVTDSRINAIQGILSLQYSRTDLPYDGAADAILRNQTLSTQCIALAWDTWRKGTQPNVCPLWTKQSTSGAPDEDGIGEIATALPDEFINTDGFLELPQTPLATVQLEKESYLYEVAFPAGGPTPNCGTVDQCARACAGGFPGFVQITDGNIVITDPAYWELSNKYPTAGGNPFLTAGYYHAMADYGPVPGDQFGHAQRAKTYDGIAERCSYYSGNKRFQTQLILSTNSTGSVSWCRSPSLIQ